jgi:hypothetical protein
MRDGAEEQSARHERVRRRMGFWKSKEGRWRLAAAALAS